MDRGEVNKLVKIFYKDHNTKSNNSTFYLEF